jgi:hypothetical protein
VQILSDCEAKHAIRMMNESVQSNTPFYIQLWFHAPHGPWEVSLLGILFWSLLCLQ